MEREKGKSEVEKKNKIERNWKTEKEKRNRKKEYSKSTIKSRVKRCKRP